MNREGLREHEWNILNKETDFLIDEISSLSPLMPYYNFLLDQKIARLEEIEAVVDDSVLAKKKESRPVLYLV